MSEGAREAGRVNVFLSYSRDDLNFADQLEAALHSHKYDVAIDRQGISAGEDWRARLGGLIRDADTVIFVLSPSSAGSELCRWEVEEASRLGKRIVPVLCRPLRNASVPSQISALNYIFFYAEPRLPGSGFGTGLVRLVSALDTDLDWLREQTRLLQRASEWDSAGRTESRLLFGDSIAEAKAWAARRPKDAPEPTALHYEFVRASEDAEARRRDAERQQLEQIAAAQADRAKALAQREEAQEREAEQARRVVRRTRIGMAVAIVLFLGTAALAVGLVGASGEADKRTEAANAAALEAVRQITRAQTSIALLWNEQGKAFEAASSALRGMVLPFNYSSDFNQTELFIDLVRAYSADGFLVPAMRHDDSIFAAAFDPKGERIITASADKTARIWNSRTGEPIGKPLQHKSRVYAAAFDSTGDRLLTASEDNTAEIWDAGTGEPIGGPMQHEVFAAAHVPVFDSTGQRVVTFANKTARIWNSRTGEPIGKPLQHAARIRAGDFDPEGQRVVTASEDQTARIWDAGTGEPIGGPLQHADAVLNATFDPTGQRILTVSADKKALIWDAPSGELIGWPLPLGTSDAGDEIEPGERQLVAGAAMFDPTGERLLTASADQTARIWDARTGEPIGKPLPHIGMFGLAMFDPTGALLLTALSLNTVRIWNAYTGEPIGEPLTHAGNVWSARFDPKGKRIVTISSPQTVSVWDAHTGQPIGKPLLNIGPHSVVAFDPEGERLITASAYDTVRIIDVRTGAPVDKTLQCSSPVIAVAFDPKGKGVVTISDDAAQIWNVGSGGPMSKMLRHAGPVTMVGFDSTGERVVTASEDRTARIWDAQTGEPIGRPMHHDGKVLVAIFDPTGEFVLTASEDKTARIWDARTGDTIGPALEHDGPVLAAAFDGTGERIVTASEDRTARIWDTHTGQPIGKPLQHSGRVLTAVFDNLGERVFTTSEGTATQKIAQRNGGWRAIPDQTVRLWNARTGEPAGQPMQVEGPISLSIDPTGERVVSGGFDPLIWDARVGKPLIRLSHQFWVGAAAFDPTGARVVTGSSWDHTARIWDVPTGEPIGKPLQHDDSVLAVAFNRTGELVVTASADKTVRIWRAPPTGQALVEEVRAKLGTEAPEPLELPGGARRHNSYGSLMALGAQTVWTSILGLFRNAPRNGESG
jgi:WD40 repeat protein